MTMVALPGPVYVPAPEFLTTGGGSMTINGAAYKAMAGFQAPKDGQITKIRFATSTVTTGCDIKARLEGIASTGAPDGTLIAASAEGTVTVSNTDDSVWKEVTLTTGPTVSQGDIMACVLQVDSGTPSNLRISAPANLLRNEIYQLSPYRGIYDGATWTLTPSGPMCLMVMYSGDTYWTIPPGHHLAIAVNNTTFNTGSTFDEIGVQFTPTVGLRMVGVMVRGTSGVGYDVCLYDDTTLLASKSVPVGYASSATAMGGMGIYFSDPYDLVAGDTYIMSMKATSGSDIYYQKMVGHTDAATGLGLRGVKRADGGAWTIDDNFMQPMAAICSHVDIPAGGGGAYSYGF